MAEHYCRASFSLLVTVEEAALIREILDLDLDGLTPSELDGFYQLRSHGFREAFPATTDDSFANFRALFSDPEDPDPCFSLATDETAGDTVTVTFFGENVDVETLANIIHAVCRSAQPCGFAYAYGCSKLRVGEFGGGYVVITSARPVYHDTDSDLKRALAEIQDEDGRALVIAKHDTEHGLGFWNNESGFGRLADATVFTPAEATRFDLPIADGQPEWLTMPPRFA